MPHDPPAPLGSPHRSDLEFALRLADVADSISVERFRALDLHIETKPDRTPVTDADRAVETALRAAIGAERPDDGVVGEEFGTAEGTAGRSWILDPIDATKNFLRGLPVWATLIALRDADHVLLGVVSAPALGHRWWAARGAGSWVARGAGQPQRNRVSAVRRLADASISYSDIAEWGGASTRFVDLLDRCWRSRAYGDFWSHLLVAEGTVDVSAEPELALWDLAALVVVVEEAGGRTSDTDGSPARHGRGLVCSNGLLHDDVLAALAP